MNVWLVLIGGPLAVFAVGWALSTGFNRLWLHLGRPDQHFLPVVGRAGLRLAQGLTVLFLATFGLILLSGAVLLIQFQAWTLLPIGTIAGLVGWWVWNDRHSEHLGVRHGGGDGGATGWGSWGGDGGGGGGGGGGDGGGGGGE